MLILLFPINQPRSNQADELIFNPPFNHLNQNNNDFKPNLAARPERSGKNDANNINDWLDERTIEVDYKKQMDLLNVKPNVGVAISRGRKGLDLLKSV